MGAANGCKQGRGEVISEEIEKRMAECRVEYAMPEPAYVALREGSEKED
jgi:hypothetical protein